MSTAFPDLIDLAALGAAGFKIQGENAGDFAGISVAVAGDVDGDGIDDLIVGAKYNDSGGSDAGAAYVVFGLDSSQAGQDFTSPVDLGDVAQGTGGFKIQGESAVDFAGRSVSAAGDVNGDGLADLIVGAQGNNSGGNDAGAAYVVFGIDQGFISPVDLDDVAQGTGGFKIQGESAGDYAGWSVAAAGDVNGDGLADLIVGAPFNGSGGGNAGAAYVVFGTDQGFTSPVDLGDVAQGTGGFKIQGESAGDYAGIAVSAAGDVNGDGIDDLIVGAQGNDSGGSFAGAAYVVFGLDTTQGGQGFTSPVDLDAVAAGTGGFKIQGESAYDFASRSVAAAGDVNGDGLGDLIVGAPNDEGGGTNAGAAYVVFGTDQGFISPVDLGAVAAGTGGFKIQGENAYDLAGISVAAAGDVNGDGLADLIVGAQRNDSGGGDAGAAYVVFGTDQGFNSPVDLGDVAAGTGGFKIQGENGGDEAGISVSAAGDVDGDGVDDLIVGANFNDSGGSFAGAAYVIRGNIAPTAVDDSADAPLDTAVPIDVLANDSDANGTLVPASVMVASQGSLGQATANLDGSITYTPNAGQSGQDSFTYTVQDDQGGTSDAATVTVTIAPPSNEPPTALDDSAQTAILTPATIDVLANDSDPDGTLDVASVTVTDDPTNGVATANPDGTVTYLPNFLFVGDDSFAYTVDDDDGATSNAATVGVSVGAEVDVVTGTNGADFRFGTNGPDLIQTLDGNDSVFARGGDDIVLGGPGRDSLFGDAGNDILMGGAGKDALAGGNGLDILVGGPGNDSLVGGGGLDTAIFAGDYADHSVSGLGTFRTVQDLAGDGGRDGLTSVELLQFDDGFFDARDGSFTPGAYATPAVETLVTSPGFTTDPEPILAPVA